GLQGQDQADVREGRLAARPGGPVQRQPGRRHAARHRHQGGRPAGRACLQGPDQVRSGAEPSDRPQWRPLGPLRRTLGGGMDVRADAALLVGEWSGHNKLWLGPDEPVRESSTSASVTAAAGGRFLVITYTWTDRG